jgi:glycine/D-amino acid oxidase-like deaminating enzyme
MSHSTADIVICGAGIAGIATAYHLVVKHGLKEVVLMDQQQPLSLTSNRSFECYRNWYPGPGNALVSLMNRSIDLMEGLAHETDNLFKLSRRGYLYATATPEGTALFQQTAEEAASLGAGPVRYHTGQAGEVAYQPALPYGFMDQPTGSDLILDPNLIRRYFPYLSAETVAVLHARRCGWLRGQQYGLYLLQQAQAHGLKLVQGRVESVKVEGGRVHSVSWGDSSGSHMLSTRTLINAAGPGQQRVAQMLGVELPIFCERHMTVIFNDHLGVIPREAPLMIWVDPVWLTWPEEKRLRLAAVRQTQALLDELQPAVHMRPRWGRDSSLVVMQWGYHTDPVEPIFPLPLNPLYPEVVLRGLAVAIPGLAAYFERSPKTVVDGGYYVKTAENRPLIGPLPVEGSYLIGALSGYGLQAAAAAGELVAAHVVGSQLPAYAPAFLLERYQDPTYQRLLENWSASGQI